MNYRLTENGIFCYHQDRVGEEVFDMSVPEEILMELEEMNDEQRVQVLDFARFLRQKEEREFDRLVDQVIDDNMEALRELA